MTEKKIYLILEYTKRTTLDEVLSAKGKLNEDYVQLYSGEIIQVIEYLHQNGIIYRDLKTSDIMIGDTGHIIMTNIEFGKKLNGQQSNPIDKVPKYTAPEVLNDNQYSEASDWWSLVFLYKTIGNYYI